MYHPDRTLQMRKKYKVYHKKVIVSVCENIVLESLFWRRALPTSAKRTKKQYFPIQMQ